MRLLLDTNALLWWATDKSRLSAPARAAIEDSATSVSVSVASLWEIAIKRALGKLRVAEDTPEDMERFGLQTVAITERHAWTAGRLPMHHRDPFDRMLVAQAQLEGLTIVTRDEQIARYQVAVMAV